MPRKPKASPNDLIKTPRGRTNIGRVEAGKDPGDKATPKPSRPHIEQIERAESSRPVGPGAGRHRGDRRDTSPTYTGNRKHSARGASGRPDVSTRAR
jgi:hypothetical protein